MKELVHVSPLQLLESAPDAMVVVDQNGTIILANSQTERLFGYSNQELIGQAVEILIPEAIRNQHSKNRTDYAIAPRFRPMGHGMELFGWRKNGAEFPVEISLSPLDTPDGLLVTAAIRDVTERKLAEREQAALLERLQTAFDEIKTLRGLIPICAWCKKIRDDKGFWQQLETYLRARTEAEFSHGICPECEKKWETRDKAQP